MDRAFTFEDPNAVRFLQDEFVPVAVDAWYLLKRQDAAGEFYRAVVSQELEITEESSTQGFYIVMADGTLVDAWSNRGNSTASPAMGAALTRLRRNKVTFKERFKGDLATAVDAEWARLPPEGGLSVNVYAKVLDGNWSEGPDGLHGRMYRESVGRDRLWVRADESEALARGEFPEALMRRIARFHLIDNTRGEPPMWSASEVKTLDLQIAPAGEGSYLVTGRIALATADGSRSYDAAVRGHVRVHEGRVARFDLVARGAFVGEGRYTRHAPKGAFTVAIAFSLAGADAKRVIPPQGSRDLEAYWKG